MNQEDPVATAFGPANVTFFTQLLAPPEGMTFQQAVGTTFTLDLETALITPTKVRPPVISVRAVKPQASRFWRADCGCLQPCLTTPGSARSPR